MGHLHHCLIFAFLFLLYQMGTAETIHEDWVKSDSIFIKQIVDIKNSDPRLINDYFKPDERYRVNLGFGYSLIEGSYGIGYVSIFYSIIYRYQKMVSYELTPQMPSDTRLTKRYLNIYRRGFQIKQLEPQAYYYNFEIVSRPIGLPSPNFYTSKEFQFLMTPYSNCVYGDYGMASGSMLMNRKLFKQLTDTLTSEKINLLLHSINPATRLITAEYFYQNIGRYPQKNRFEKVITDFLMNLPIIQTFQGCCLTKVDSRGLLLDMIRKKN